MPPKRSSDEEPLTANKIQRIEQNSTDFSSSVKRRLAESKRTGQACDRCKIRKIRCDGRPEGCTPCEQNKSACQTTDRITGRATVRGHAEAMESENQYLRRQIAELQEQLKENSIEPRAYPAYSSLQPPTLLAWSSSRPQESQGWSDPNRWTSTPLPGYAPAGAADKMEYRPLPHFKHGSMGDNYLGVGAGDTSLSHIRGTSLSVFGQSIDITDYMEPEAKYESSVMSYRALIKVALGGEHVEPVPLPPYHALREYAMWYLRSLNPYTMLLHKPAFMQLIWKIGHDPNFTPSASETVTVHMMLATIQYQIGTRNSASSALLDESHKHYRYALSFYKQLLAGSHRLEDVQAQAMICHHLRNFPKPGAAWIMTSLTYLFALELGLHRSLKNWAGATDRMSKLEIEMRKRVFWTLNALQVNLNGKLGRPMPISNEDIDVEFPEPLSDCLPDEEAELDAFHQCSFQVGIQIAKYTKWEVDLYKMLYSVRYAPGAYVERLKYLEAGIRQWKDELPYELRDPANASQNDQIFCLYLENWYRAFQLLLHHPAVCRSTDPGIVEANLNTCLDASQRMLQNCNTLMLKKSLDIPWINTVVYIAAMFTTLFISSVRKDELSPVDVAKLKSDMKTWVDVLGDCDSFLGSGGRLKKAVAKIAETSLDSINDSIVKRTASESLARVALQTPQQSTSNTSAYSSSPFQASYTAPSTMPLDPISASQSAAYPSLSATITHPYTLGTPIPVPQQTTTTFDSTQHTYPTDDPSIPQSHTAVLANRQPPDAYPYTPSVTSPQQMYPANAYAAHDWHQWTRTYMQPQNIGQTGEYMSTATTLMALGRDGAAQEGGGAGLAWPQLAYGQGGGQG